MEFTQGQQEIVQDALALDGIPCVSVALVEGLEIVTLNESHGILEVKS